MDHIDRMDQKYAENTDKMSRNMETLTNSISNGFELLRQMMTYQQPPPMYSHQGYGPYMQGPSTLSPGMPPYHSPGRSFTSHQSEDSAFDEQYQGQR